MGLDTDMSENMWSVARVIWPVSMSLGALKMITSGLRCIECHFVSLFGGRIYGGRCPMEAIYLTFVAVLVVVPDTVTEDQFWGSWISLSHEETLSPALGVETYMYWAFAPKARSPTTSRYSPICDHSTGPC